MIRKIKVKFIALSMTALLVLLAVIVTGMNIINYNAIIADADDTLELLSQNKGTFPDFSGDKKSSIPRNMSQETPYETRYFSVLLDPDGDVKQTDTSRIKAIDTDAAIVYANSVLSGNQDSGFLEAYRFIVYKEGKLTRITFLDCGRKIDSFQRFLSSSILMALAGYILFFLVIVFFSNKILQPVTESYEKQKRFITDAGHEIKTPLTIIKANVDVLELEMGENEWLEGIQNQVSRLSTLTNDLVYLSRMEEAEDSMPLIAFPFSDVVLETASAFQALAQTQNKAFACSVQPMLTLVGNEKAIRQLVDILMDNAMKYSPEGGQVSLTVQKQGRQIRLSVFNTACAPVSKENLNRLFDRFYRMDTSRSSQTGGYGIGLSVAKAIVSAHNGKISATSKDGQSLEITVHFST